MLEMIFPRQRFHKKLCSPPVVPLQLSAVAGTDCVLLAGHVGEELGRDQREMRTGGRCRRARRSIRRE